MRSTANIKVNKPIEEVWKFVSNLRNIDQWLDGVSEPKPAFEAEIGLGSTFISKYVFDNKSHDVSYVLTSCEPPRRFAYRVAGGPHPCFNVVDLKSKGGATRVSHTMEMDMGQSVIGAVFLGLGPIVRLSITFKLRKDLKRLKARLEAN